MRCRSTARALAAAILAALVTGGLGADPAAAAPGDPGRPVELERAAFLTGPRLTDDGQMVYIAGPDDTRVGLYVMSLDGGEARLLTDQVNRNTSYALTPDDESVLFFGGAAPASDHLYTVALTGGDVVDLTPDIRAGATVLSWQFSPDGEWIVLQADLVTAGVLDLFFLPMDGGEPIGTGAPLAAGQAVERFGITEDGSHVVYMADWRVDDVVELLSLPLPPGPDLPTALNPPLAAGQNVDFYTESPDSQTIVYFADQAADGQHDMFAVPVDGSATPVPLQPGTLPEPEHFGVLNGSEFSPDSSRVTFTGRFGLSTTSDLYVASVASGGPTRLSGSFPSGGVSDAEIAPDGATVVYAWRTSDQPSQVSSAWSVPVGGGPGTELLGETPDFIDLRIVTPASTHALLARSGAAGVDLGTSWPTSSVRMGQTSWPAPPVPTCSSAAVAMTSSTGAPARTRSVRVGVPTP